MLELSPDDLERHIAQLERITDDDKIVELVEIYMNTFNPISEGENECLD